MISSKNIRFHAPSNTYIIPKNSLIDYNLAIAGNVIVGPGTRFWKNIKTDGNIQLGKGCTVEGNIKAGQVIVGPRSVVKGSITADADVSLFQNAAVGTIESSGNITIMPGCLVGYANGSTLQVIGKAEIKKIGVITKVTVRANTVTEWEEEKEDNAEETPSADVFMPDETVFQAPADEQSIEDNPNRLEESDLNDIYKNKNEQESDSILNSKTTPLFPLENNTESLNADVLKDCFSAEESDAEVIENTDENSSLSLRMAAFKMPSSPTIRIPEEESGEVEIVSSSVPEPENGRLSVPKTVETPFGTIVVGEQPSENVFVEESPDSLFASVTAFPKEEQEAAEEAELKSEAGKSKSAWPAFEPMFVPEKKSRPYHSNQDVSARPEDGAQVRFEEIRIPNMPADKNRAAKTQKTENSHKSNSKIIFEEIGQNHRLQTTEEFGSQIAQQSVSAEKRTVSPDLPLAGIEKSKAWYEERFPRADSKKKEYPPYV